jgi:hypothetical protein
MARPSDEMSQLNLINRDLERFLSGLNKQQKQTLKQIEYMSILVDFSALSKVGVSNYLICMDRIQLRKRLAHRQKATLLYEGMR